MSADKEDSENCISLLNVPKKPDKVITLQELVKPIRMQYRHLTGDAILNDDTQSISISKSGIICRFR